MSDKSFGDHPNRNIVKNPLLSSAVTGLSIEDLTHKAVLLPVTPSQGLITRPDQQQGPQTRTLVHTDHGTATLPSGDALQNITLTNTTPMSNLNDKNTFDNQNIVKQDKNRTITQSKTSLRSEDDFDVNEYIARLQGTRYVSAPLHSHLKEDKNSNLEATEENLEEINLNESQSPVETQQSLTADIAQNFSQLPAVLPHVASAVFSSFSNMLYKSREQTPDVNPGVDPRYNEVQFQRPELGVPLQEEFNAPKEVGPPPKETPVGGSSTFRIATKKKYAQIPGLSSGDAQTMTIGGPTPFGQPPNTGQSMPPMVPQNLPSMPQAPPSLPPIGQSMLPTGTVPPFGHNVSSVQNVPGTDQKPQFVQPATIGQTSAFVPSIPNIGTNIGPPVSTIFNPKDSKLDQNVGPAQHKIFNPLENLNVASENFASESLPKPPVNKDNNKFFTPIEQKENIPANTPAIIPPPPMFSNLPRGESLSAGKSILPPSVARRISANQPLIKPQVSATTFTENIFVPTIPADSQNAIPGYSASAFVPASPNVAGPIVPPPIIQQEEKPHSILTPKEIAPPTSSKVDVSTNPLATQAIPSYPANVNIPSIPSQFESAIPSSSKAATIPPVSFFTPEAVKSDSQAIPPPPTFFNPPQSRSQDAPHPITQLPPNATPEPTRPIPEPPKATAGNFRMTKKRPQYYAGPIEGVGDISNSVKPTIPVAMPTSKFQGAFFTPAPVEQTTEVYADPIIDQSSVPFDISQPANVAPGKPVEFNMPLDYSAYHLRQGQNQSYDQDFNTSFDLSRATTDAYDAPKEESSSDRIGFGIIGSLKSKLSSIDINKIQNSVTTFFDPAYNTKVSDPVPQENQPLFGQNNAQFGNTDQSNLEIFVGSQNANYNHQYYQTQQYYGQDYSSSYFTDPNASQTQTAYADNSANTHYAYTQQNIPDTAGFKSVDSFYNPSEFTQSTEQMPSYGAQDTAKGPLAKKEESVAFFNPAMPAQAHEIKNIPLSRQNLQSSIQENEYNPNVQSHQTPNITPLDVSAGYSDTDNSQNVSAPPVMKESQENVAFYNPNAFISKEAQKKDTPFNIAEQATSSIHKTTSGTLLPADVKGYCDSALNTDKYNVSSSYSNANTNQKNSAAPAIESQDKVEFYNPNTFSSQEAQNTPFNITEQNTSNIHKASSDTILPADVKGYCDSALNTDKYNVSSSYSNTNTKQNKSAQPAKTESQDNVEFYNPNAFTSEGVQKNNTPFNITTQTVSNIHKTTSDTQLPSDVEGYCDSALNTDKYNVSANYSNTSNNQNISAPPAKIEYQESVEFYNPNAFTSHEAQNKDTLFNIIGHQPMSTNVQGSSEKLEPTDRDDSCDSALNTDKYNFPGIETPTVQPHPSNESIVSAASFFDSPETLNQSFSAENLDPKISVSAFAKYDTNLEETMSVFSPVPAFGTPLAPIGTKSKTEIKGDGEEQKDKNLTKSLSKDKIPVFGVSSVPLFGLSTLIADATKETDAENVGLFSQKPFDSSFASNAGISFFENMTMEQKDNKPKDPSDLDISVLKITDVKNVLLMEPPIETIGAVLKRNASSSKLEAKVSDTPEKFKQNIPSIDHQAHDNFDNQNENFFKHQSSDQHAQEHVQKADNLVADDSELNICETCREVNTPDLVESKPKEEDLTTQLIENLTSRISLSHPLTVPLTENDATQELPEVNDELQEITNIVEDTIETLQVQSATELLDEEMTSGPKNYGWTEGAYSNLGDQQIHDIETENKEQDYGFKIDSEIPPIDQDYEFKLDPSAIGFFGKESLFFEAVPQNASDEIKAEIKNSHEDIVLPRQMSIPSAPPAEDDSKSDETGGLDVQSIEQDAKKDFPLEEEFIIEPSETDDDKIEFRERKRSSEDSNSSDTFTNRVERFQKTADHFIDDAFEQKDAQISNPPISMASYFDTGNYAVESHYKNSMSPVQMLHTYHHRPSFEYVSIPPGFEEQYKNMFKDMGPVPDAPYIPETSTQTRVTSTPTFSTPQATKTSETFSQIFGAKTETQTVGSEPSQTLNISNVQNVETAQSLADPMNFFAKEDPKPPQEAESFNRLASYFSVPAPQPDHSKSFFELSESQNHYRHENQTEDVKKSFFELSQSQNHYIDDVTKNNIADLMMDLTSPQNLREQIVTTVNYFSVEHDNVTNNAARPIKINLNNLNNFTNTKVDIEKINTNTTNDFFKTQDVKTEQLNKTQTKKPDFKLVEIDKDPNIILNCENCAKHIQLPSKFKVRTAVNDNSDAAIASKMANETKETTAKNSVSISLGTDVEKEPHQSINVINEPRITSDYAPVKHHWFYRVDVEDKSVWRGFSITDSKALEDSFNSPDLDENTLVATDGGRYDVNVVGRLRIAVYWKEKPTNVRRCSWYYKGTTDSRYVPYTETVAEKLEEEYRHGVLTGEWHRKLSLPNSEMVIMHGPSVMVHFLQSSATDAFTTPPNVLGKRVYRNPVKISMAREWPPDIDHLVLMIHGAGECTKDLQATSRPRVVRRGHEESEIEDCEPSRIEHLLLLCHGVGSACDLRFRSVEEVVDDFRTTSFQLLQSHYKNSYDNGIVNRIEVLPISWHAQLHSGETGVDSRLSRVTLDSIPRLRAFTNNTVLDVLFYTSPVFHQMIVDTVCSEMNRVYTLFKARNPGFTGQVSLGGHSLGSVILYDLLCNQTPESPTKNKPTKTYVSTASASTTPDNYPQLKFHPAALYALGSPIAIFECIRGVESLGLNFQLPTCKNFFNIFHPYDPIAYRIEPLINSELQQVKPDLIPHHKGRKRMHLELKDTMTRVGADLKQKLIESVRTTWNKWTAQPSTNGHLEKVVEEDMEREQLCDDKEEKASELQATSEMLGSLNSGRRIDYVLQEAPLEMINEYLFAMSSHVGYWESEDTMLLMLREVYSSLGVQPDCTVPQQCMTVQRTSMDEASILSEKDHPSTSRGSAL